MASIPFLKIDHLDLHQFPFLVWHHFLLTRPGGLGEAVFNLLIDGAINRLTLNLLCLLVLAENEIVCYLVQGSFWSHTRSGVIDSAT
jgi:hypothetical protein